MKNEEFDEIIREKLDHLNPGFAEADIDKVFQHVLKPGRTPLRWRSGKWFYSIFTAAVITAVTFWALHRNGSNTPAIAKKTAESAQQVKDTTGVQIPSYKATATETVPASSTSTYSVKTAIQQHITLPGATANYASDKPTPVNQKSAIQSGNLAKSSENRIQKQSSETETEIPGDVTEEKSKVLKVQDQLQEVPSAGTPVDREEPAILLQKQENSVIESISETKPTVVSPDSGEIKMIVTEPATAGDAKEKSTFSWSHLAAKTAPSGFRLNASFPYSNQSVAASVSGEMIWGKHFGLSAGLKYTWTQVEKFEDPVDMYQHKHHGFNPRVEDHFHEFDNVRDITIRNSFLQVPLLISYHIPFKNDIALTFDFGSELDVYLNQKVELMRIDTFNSQPDRFKAPGKVIPFNSLIISTRLSKQWNHWGVYFNPFITPRLREVFYKPKDVEFGTGFGVTYRFK